ncbi:histone-lysine N-methyltransferase ASHR1 [Panicum miliaceum]|uniref:Histone-lysine N-methyltransferase ASHR1 n=1 Tax=Panicum miliaceum TaxID=4540 RepID=A0A3L6SB25_PANMI|nr:histone-lysine N-methyltransferase ASHR1 [Panicum miliaceum]
MANWAEQLQGELAGRGLAVASIPGKGRGLVASRTFFQGEVIISQEPYASTPNKILVGSSCDHCFASSNLRKCSPHASVVMHGRSFSSYRAFDDDMFFISLWNAVSAENISEVDKDQLVLYAQMANLVDLILPSLELDLKEIAHTFSKVSISYIETAAVTKKRQSDLKQYFFTCTCPRCVKGSEDNALLESYRCKNEACDGFLLPESGEKAYTCQKCSISRDEEEVKKTTREIVLLSDKASSLLSSGSSIYKTIEQLEQKLYHAFSITLLHTRETLLKIYMELQDWQTALRYCRSTIPVYERVYPPFHPMIGLQFYTCGKLEWLLECTEDALKSLTRAADILRITHGTKSQFMKELFGKLEEARAEVSFRLSSGRGHGEQFS